MIVPKEVVLSGGSLLANYLKLIAEGSAPVKKVKVIVVGEISSDNSNNGSYDTTMIINSLLASEKQTRRNRTRKMPSESSGSGSISNSNSNNNNNSSSSYPPVSSDPPSPNIRSSINTTNNTTPPGSPTSFTPATTGTTRSRILISGAISTSTHRSQSELQLQQQIQQPITPELNAVDPLNATVSRTKTTRGGSLINSEESSSSSSNYSVGNPANAGIAVNEWKYKTSENGTITYEIWDFPGQVIYLYIHISLSSTNL